MFRNNYLKQKYSLNALLIEDNLGDAYIIKQLLKFASSLNFYVTHCSRLSLGIEQLNKKQFDVKTISTFFKD